MQQLVRSVFCSQFCSLLPYFPFFCLFLLLRIFTGFLSSFFNFIHLLNLQKMSATAAPQPDQVKEGKELVVFCDLVLLSPSWEPLLQEQKANSCLQWVSYHLTYRSLSYLILLDVFTMFFFPLLCGPLRICSPKKY